VLFDPNTSKMRAIPSHIILNTVLSVLLLFVSCKNEREKTQPAVQDITESVYASGIVKSENQYQVFATVNGLIKGVLVTEGDMVKKDQPIISIVNETSELNRQNAQLAAEYANVNANRDKLNELRINIDMARTRMQNDSTLLERQRSLWAQQIGTHNDLEQRELAYQNSVTTYKAAILRYNDMERQLNFAARQALKNLEISTTLSGDYIIRSRTDGKVYSVLKERGEMVNPQSPVAVIGDADHFLLELQVDEYDIAKIRLGQQVLINMDSYKGQVFEGKITKIDPIMDQRSRSFTLEAVYTKEPSVLYPNLTVEANIIIETKKHALTIPRSYLTDDNYVITADKQKKKVTTGLKDYQRVEIISGLNKNDVILKPVP
jgi:HlyD family secretion protein